MTIETKTPDSDKGPPRINKYDNNKYVLLINDD